MSLSTRQKPYQALTYVNIPFNDEPPYAPGEMIEIQTLVDAGQTDEDIDNLIAAGALGEETDEIHPDHLIPDPAVPTVQTLVAQAQAMVERLKETGQKVPKELRELSKLDVSHVVATDYATATEIAGGGEQ